MNKQQVWVVKFFDNSFSDADAIFSSFDKAYKYLTQEVARCQPYWKNFSCINDSQLALDTPDFHFGFAEYCFYYEDEKINVTIYSTEIDLEDKEEG